MTRLTATVLITLLAVGALAAPSVSDILPSDAFLVAGTPNATALRVGFEGSPAGRLWQDPTMRAFLAPLLDEFWDSFNLQHDSSILSAEEFGEIFPGQIALALRLLDGGANGFSVHLVAETTRPQRAMEIVDELLARVGAETTRDTIQIGDDTVARSHLRLARPAALPGDTTGDFIPLQSEVAATLHTVVTDGLLIFSIDETPAPLLANLRGTGDGGFARGASFQRTAAMAGNPAHQFLLHFNPVPLTAAMIQTAPATPQFNFAALGLGDFQGMTAWMNFGAEATDMWFALGVRPQPMGLGRLLRHCGASDFTMLEWASPDAIALSAGHCDIGGMWNDLRQILTASSPMIGTMLSGFLMTANQSLGFNIEADLISNLGGEFVSHTIEGGNAVVMGLTNPGPVADVLARLAQPSVVGTGVGSTPMLTAQEHRGQTYYSPPTIFTAPGMSAGQPSFAVAGDHLLFASSVPEMHRLIAAAQGERGTSVLDTPLWATIQAQQIDGANSLGYQDDAAVMSELLVALQQMAMLSLMMPQFSLPFDFTQTPSPELFEQHLTHTVTSTRIDADGMVSRSHTPNHR